MKKGSIKIVHLTSVHDPFDVRVFYKECKSLVEAGYDVVLVAPYERDRTVDGVRIHAVKRPTSRRERMTQTTWRVFKAALGENAQLYHFHDPELIPIGLLLKLYGRRVVYDVHENITEDLLTKDYIPLQFRKAIASWVGRIEHCAAFFFDRIVAATPAIARSFSKRKTVTVQNFPALDKLASVTSRYSNRSFIAAYIGEVTLIRGIKEMITAMAMLPKAMDAKLVLAAKFRPPELEHEIKQMPGWDRVDFVGWRSREEVAALLDQARVGLVLFHPVPNYMDAQPHKLFDYLSAGIPIIASDFPLWREIIQSSGSCGLLVDPLNPEAIAKAMMWLFEHPEEAESMGKKGRDATRSRFNWNNERAKLLDSYQALLRSTPQETLEQA